MIPAYLAPALLQARERARILKAKVPTPVSAPELIPLQRLCEERLDGVIRTLDYLKDDPEITQEDNIRERIRLFRRTMADLSRVETSGILALSRPHADDIFLNRVVFQVHQQIRYPIPPPCVACISTKYFFINTSLHLLQVPPAESDFLLHLPDLYHELGHPLIALQDTPKVESFQAELARFLQIVFNHFEKERVANIRSTGPRDHIGQALDIYERFWTRWATEMFCDLFGLYTAGPCYAWAHFHLTAKNEGDPFDVSFGRVMSHPPDQARMESLLYGLDLLGMNDIQKKIKTAWDGLISATGCIEPPMYRRACPKTLLEQAAVHALEGTKKIGCQIFQPQGSATFSVLLNSAWDKFWTMPDRYHEWERQQIGLLRTELVPTEVSPTATAMKQFANS